MNALVFDNVTLGYDEHPAVHRLSATIPAGSLTALVGPNGAGKSTLMKGIVGELTPRAGRIERPTNRHSIAYLPQLADLDRGVPITVYEMVAMGLWRHIGAFGRIKADGRSAIEEAIASVGLGGFERRQIGALSGGQLQRVIFARLMVQDAPVILLDEPFTAIDRRTTDDLIAVIRRWHGEGRTILAVLHDLHEVRANFSHTMLIARELIAEGPTATVLSSENLFRARAASEAFDEEAAVCRSCAA